MARQSSRSGGRSSGFSSRTPSYGRASSPNTSSARPQATQRPVQTAQATPPMQSSGGGMLGGIGSTIVQGMAFGGGSEIGHQVVRSMMGGSSHGNHQGENQNAPVQQNQQQQQQTTQNENPCSGFNMKFVECLKTSNNEISSCQSIFNDLKLCQNSMI